MDELCNNGFNYQCGCQVMLQGFLAGCASCGKRDGCNHLRIIMAGIEMGQKIGDAFSKAMDGEKDGEAVRLRESGEVQGKGMGDGKKQESEVPDESVPEKQGLR